MKSLVIGCGLCVSLVISCLSEPPALSLSRSCPKNRLLERRRYDIFLSEYFYKDQGDCNFSWVLEIV
jgi:hypothetical protein